jgi:hypothetical protein
VFATDHPDGKKIMEYVFKKMYSNPKKSKAHPDQPWLF